MKPKTSLSVRRSRLAVLAAAAVILICAAWAAWEAKEEREANPSADKLIHDTAELWELAGPIYDGGAAEAEWTVRWDVQDESSGMTLEKLTDMLLGGEGEDQGVGAAGSPDKLVAREGDRVELPLPDYGGKLTVNSLGPAEGESYPAYVLLYTTDQGRPAQREKLTALLEHVRLTLTDAKLLYSGSVSMRGLTNEPSGADKLAAQAGAREIDRYEDGGTTSATYWSPKLLSHVKVGEERVANLQIAQHKRTDAAGYELTVGMPLISGDYSAAGSSND